jgi:aminomethyltransferase
MVPFGGWDMPLSYPAGTLEEHRACRTGAVAFDVSHLGTVRVEGPGAHAALQPTLTNDLDRITPGRAQYTHLLDPADGSVVDDIIVWWLAPEVFDVMPNASNTDGVRAALELTSDDHAVTVTDTTDSRALIAVQGPEARRLLATVAPAAAEVGRFRTQTFEYRGHRCVVAGTGYTGEDGVECSVPVDAATEMWRALMDAGVQPAGLGARDTLRLEAGLPLHGNELGAGITPLNAGLGWVVSWTKGEFLGREALERQRDAAIDPVLVGLRLEGRRPPRTDQSVVRDGRTVGRVSSGNFSPMLECGIALAFVESGVGIGDEVAVDMRGTSVPARCVELPFVARP